LDRSAARDRAENFKHSLAKNRDFRRYFTQKVNLLEAGVTEEEEIAQKVWKGLDPLLMNSLEMSHGYGCLETFLNKVYSQECSVKKLWQKMHRSSTPNLPQKAERGPITRYDFTKMVNSHGNSPPPKATGSSGLKPEKPDSTAKSLVSFQAGLIRPPGEPFPPTRPCKTCGGDHLAFMCPKRVTKAVKAYFAGEDIEDGRAYWLSEQEEAILSK
jgi:hypothetical protein